MSTDGNTYRWTFLLQVVGATGVQSQDTNHILRPTTFRKATNGTLSLHDRTVLFPVAPFNNVFDYSRLDNPTRNDYYIILILIRQQWNQRFAYTYS